MPYLQLTLPICDTELTEIESLLVRAGALSVTLSDSDDQPILEPGPGETPVWQNLLLTALFSTATRKAKIEAHLGHRAYQWQILEEQDWERAWLKDYQPIQFDQTLWIGPQDFTPPSDVKATLFLDPGLAFGTGAHPTTYLCLAYLSEEDLQGKILLDFGCGSGILALAAVKLGAAQTFGLDIDPQALIAAEENARRNGIGAQFSTFYSGQTVDILIANILANPLITLAPRLTSSLKPGSMIILSGILEEQVDRVKQAYLPDIHWFDIKIKDGWARLSGQKT